MTAPFDDARARLNALVLAIAQALYGSTTTAMVITSGLVGSQLAPSPFWSTMPFTAMIVGTASTTYPVSMAMRRIGRRAGFMLAAMVGMIGALTGVTALYLRSFELFLLGSFLLGVYQASSSYYRFAAADLASPKFRPTAISWVMTGGVVAALVGTVMVMNTVDLLAPVTFAGTWVAMAVIAAVATLILSFVDIPKQDATVTSSGRPLIEIATQPSYIVAAGLGMMSYGIMVLVMTATPVAMLGCGFTVTDSSWVIQWHALAMFVPSFFTGMLITRFGAERISMIGLALLVLAAVAALMGIHFENFAVGLILLGLGWNFGYIGGTTLLTTTYEPLERNKAQGLNDFLIFGTNTLASLSAGALVAGLGWNAVNYAVFPMAAVGVALIVWLWRKGAVAA
jgi:MFS family permease